MTTIEMLSVTQVAEELDVDRSKIFRLIKKGKLVSQRAGWVHLISRDDIPFIREKLGLEDKTSEDLSAS